MVWCTNKPEHSTKSNLIFALTKSLKALSLSNKFCHRNPIHMLSSLIFLSFSYLPNIASCQSNQIENGLMLYPENTINSNSVDRDKLIQLQFKINSTKIKFNRKLTLEDSFISLVSHCLKLRSKNSAVEV